MLPFSNLNASGGNSFAEFKTKSSNSFNPFSVTKDLASSPSTVGTSTVSSFAGSGFFFGDSDDSIWGGTSNATDAPDGLSANTFVFPNRNARSRYLFLRDFDIDIPCNAVITDITFNVTRRNNSTVDAMDVEVRVFNPITLDLGAENNANPNIWLEGGAFETISYSSPDWGENLTPEILSNTRFGLAIQVGNIENAGRIEALVDAVEMVVCYDIDGPALDTPITFETVKTDACFDQGIIEIIANGGSGDLEFSIDDGDTFQSDNVFDNLPFGDYIVIARNSNGTCTTERFFCSVSSDDRILQPGDLLVTCATFPGSRVTLAVEKAQPFNDFFNDGLLGTDVSTFIPANRNEWTVEQLGGEVFSVCTDPMRNLYTATTTLYDLNPNANINPRVSRIDAITGNVSTLATLPGRVGAAAVECDTICDQLYVVNLDDGNIYRMDQVTGATLSTFDPLTPDDGVLGYAPLGERIVAATYNYADNRLYYSVWSSDFNMTQIRNTIRSVAIDPATCDFLPGTDQEEIVLPWVSEYGNLAATSNFSMPVGDIAFSQDGMTMLLSEVGFNSINSSSLPHQARVLVYNGTSVNWTLSTNIIAGNTNLQHEVGEVNNGLNARGGVDFANAGFDADGCSVDNEEFIIATADALRGANCNTIGCVYGVQYLPIAGGRSTTSVLLDIGRDFASQNKSVFGDVDVIRGCPEVELCCPDLTSNAVDGTICPGDAPPSIMATTEADAVSVVVHTTLPADSIAIYNDGMVIATEMTSGGTATGPAGGTATLDLSNFPTAPGVYFAYVIVSPTPGSLACRPNVPFEITVAEPTTVSVTGPTFACLNDGNITFTGSPAPTAGSSAGVFTTTATAGLTDNGDGTATFDPLQSDIGTFDVIYTYTDDNGCDVAATATVEIDPCFEFDLSLTKTITSAGPFPPGSSVTYDITVTNEGDLEGIDIEVLDSAPAGLTFVSSNAMTNANITDNTGGLYTIASVPVAGSETITLTYTVDLDFMGTTLTNSAQITADNGMDRDSDPDTDNTEDDLNDGIPDDDEDEATINLNQTFDLALDQTLISMGPFMAGDNVVFEITVTNEGTLVADMTTVDNIASTGLIFVSDDSASNPNISSVTPGQFNIDLLNPNDVEVITVTYQIAPGFMGTTLDNISEITVDSGDDIDSDPDSDINTDDLGDGIADDDEGIATVNIGQVFDLALSKTVVSTGPFTQGSNVTYLITVNNEGTLDANNVEVTDTPNAGLTFVSSNAAANPNVTEVSPGVYLFSQIPATESGTVEVTYQIDPTFMGLSIGNTAQITQDEGDDMDSNPDQGPDVDDNDDGLPDDDEDTADITVDQVYDLSLEKTVTSAGPFGPGSSITYQLILSNQGSFDASGIELQDIAEGGLIYVSSDAASNPNVTETSPGIWTINTVNATATETINVTYQVDPLFMGASLTNNVQITEDDGDDIDSDPDSDNTIDDLGDGIDDDDEDEVTVVINQIFDLSVNKTVVSNGPFIAGDNVTYSITVNNEGTINATDTEVTDLSSPGLIYVSSNAMTNPNVTETSPGVFVISTIPAQGSESVEITFQIDPDLQNPVVGNSVEITDDSGDDVDSNPDQGPDTDDNNDGIDDDDEDDTDIQVDLNFDLALTKTVLTNGPFSPGSIIQFAIEVVNQGTITANNTQVEDTPTASLIFQSDDAGANPNVTSLGNGVYEIGTIAAGSSETIILEYQIDVLFTSGPVGNQAQIIEDNGNDMDSNPNEGFDVDDNGDGLPDDDEDTTTLSVPVNGAVGDFVFEDSNGNGIQDFNENGVPGVIVNLMNSNGFTVDTQVTDTNGNYLFTDVPSGNYFIEIVLPDEFSSTIANAGGDDTLDNDLDDSNGIGTTAIFTLGQGETDLSLDLGINVCIPIGDFVFLDYNENDLQDPQENGINGLRVELFRQNVNGAFVLFDVTTTGHRSGTASDDGYYKFCVPPGNYYVRFVNPPLQLVPVVPNIGISDEVDSDITGAFGAGTTDSFTVVSGDMRCDIDAGFYPMGTIGDFVWFDTNDNGLRESNEIGVEGVVVRAINQDGDVVATDVTDAEGNYKLDYLTKSNMYLEFDAPLGFSFTQAHAGTNEELDSDVDESNGRNTTKFYTVLPGIHIPNIDAGLKSGVLAVEWNDVKAENADNHNLIEWSIESDVDVSHYIIERAYEDISDFNEISKVLSDKDEEQGVSHYDYKDFDIIDPGFYYYRIIQTDINGGSTTSKVVSVEVRQGLSNKIKLYPNPVSSELIVELDIDKEIEDLNIQLYDKLGQLVKSNLLNRQNVNTGRNQYNIEVTDIPDGMYNVKINIDNEVIFKKLIVIKE
jgi:uncharacterized repeat protein (TIGR01451 family)